MVRLLLDAGADIDERDYVMGWTALICAARAGHLEVVKMLIAAGAFVNELDVEDWTALMHAAHAGHADVVRTLIDSGANLDVREAQFYTGEGLKPVNPRTAVGVAAARGHAEIVRMLRDAGAVE